ncbi:MAG: helix-turn-helix domain-containing protein [Clostridia bacterium]|nr:helix-turn-helix domain-containing protein [Clostridia bacterium]
MEIGYKVKTLRLKNNLTQEELADRCDLTKGYISQLENDLTNPTLDTLNDILVVLGSSLGDFFEDKESENIVFTDADFVVKDYGDTTTTWLIQSAQKNEMEPIILELKEKGSEETDMPHEGEEFGYVLEGKIKLILGKTSYVVNKNEAFYYKADKKHKLENISDGVSKVLWISCPPNF